MVTINTMPKEAMAELLEFLADNESFRSVEKLLDGTMTVEEVRGGLRDVALALRRDAVADSEGMGLDKTVKISRKTKEVLSCLSSLEEKKLLGAFGFTEGK